MCPASKDNAHLEANIQNDLNAWLHNHEIIWRQMSRETWLKDGDRNTQFFHLSIVIRRGRNSIDVIRADNGDWITTKADIKEFVVSKFQTLFTEEPISFPSDLEGLISPSISPQDNVSLCQIPSPSEIKETVFGMQNLKALGPDGFLAIFYKKKYWSIVGDSVIKAVQEFFRSGRMLAEVNSSIIVLIPKIKSPSSVNHYRPISFCNTIYKTIAKILVSKVKPLLDKLISPSQSAFIPDC
jgi:hypothetical protein